MPAIDAATGKRGLLKVFGTDYPTPDGTCLRDYVHVDDLSRAHIAVFDQLEGEPQFVHYNLGTGNPSSVKEVLDAVGEVVGTPVPYENAPRREGDPPSLYANASKANQDLGWQPQYKTITAIIESAWKWHAKNPEGYAK